MAGPYANHLTRSNLWSSTLKEVLQEEIMGLGYVKWLTEFTDGDIFNIPSIGVPEVYDYEEGQTVRYNEMDTGNFTFSITDYVASGTFISKKRMQDMHYMNEVVSSFVPKQRDQIMRRMESDLLAVGPAGQTQNDFNTINGGRHRLAGSGTSGVIALNDFAKARYALKRAGVPDRNLIAFVDPTVTMTLNGLTALTSVAYNPRWEGMVSTGLATGTRFLYNMFGFDVYEVNNLPLATTTEGTTGIQSGDVLNLFFSGDASVTPFVGSVRQEPQVDSEYNKDLQREEYVTTARYGFALYRPENLVVIGTDPGQVYA